MGRPTLVLWSGEYEAPEGAPTCQVCGSQLLWCPEISEWGGVEETDAYTSAAVLRELDSFLTDCFLADARCPKCEANGWPEDADVSVLDKLDKTHLDFQDWVVERINSGVERILVVYGDRVVTAIQERWDAYEQAQREAAERAAHPVLPLFEEAA